MIVQREEKKDNRGFSLVELIIVIAIMAILVAVLAPQFLKYVENSRNAADVDNAKEITNAIQAYVADTEGVGFTKGKTTTIVVKGASTGYSITGDDAALVVKSLVDAGLLPSGTTATTGTEFSCRSSTLWDNYKIEVICDSSNGNVSFKYTGYKGTDKAKEFAAKFQGGKTTTTSGGGT